jgi:hypothetical protein
MKTTTAATVYPLFFRSSTGYDFWKIDSSESGHFLRNMAAKNGGYCYQSNDVREGEVSLVMKDSKLEPISEKEYLEAVKFQMKRNQAGLLRITEKLLEL